MKFVRLAPNGVLSIGRSIWMFTRVRTEDDYDFLDDGSIDIIAYRSFVLHVGRLHLTLEWRLR